MKLKVDTLKHIHDHGLAVQFAAPRLVSLVDELKRKDGKTVLTAGESKLTLWKLGPVLFSEAYWAHGSYHLASVHYLAETPAGLLKYTLKREDTEGAASAHDTLRAVILGDRELPRVWKTGSGAEQDTLRAWACRWAWTLSGACGLRAQAMQTLLRSAAVSVDRCRAAVLQCEQEARRLERWTPVVYAAHLESLRTEAARRAEENREAIRKAEARLAAVESFNWTEAAQADWSKDRVPDIAAVISNFHLSGLVWNSSPNSWYRTQPVVPDTEGPRFPAEGEKVWPVHQVPNYSASLDGDTLRPSSGIVCEFSAPQLLAWLKGEAEAPRTRYGVVSKVETVRRDASATVTGGWAPAVLVRCGCHIVDIAQDLGGAYAEALRPSHSVTYSAQAPACYLKTDPEGFKARAVEICRRTIAEAKETHAEGLRNYLRRRQDTKAEAAETPLRQAKARQAIAEAKEALAKAEEARAALPLPLGANLETAQRNACVALVALSGRNGSLVESADRAQNGGVL